MQRIPLPLSAVICFQTCDHSGFSSGLAWLEPWECFIFVLQRCGLAFGMSGLPFAHQLLAIAKALCNTGALAFSVLQLQQAEYFTPKLNYMTFSLMEVVWVRHRYDREVRVDQRSERMCALLCRRNLTFYKSDSTFRQLKLGLVSLKQSLMLNPYHEFENKVKVLPVCSPD